VARRHFVALLAPSAVLLAGWGLYQLRPATAALWLLGLALGAALQRSRFCVAAAFRDSILFHDGGPAKAVLLALALSSVAFGWMQYGALARGEAPPGNLWPVSPATVVGSVLFGIGIVPAGGCAISTLLRLGEGHLRFLWTLIGLIIGALLGAYQYGWWQQFGGMSDSFHFPTEFGWPGAIALQTLLLGGAYALLTWWERKGIKRT